MQFNDPNCFLDFQDFISRTCRVCLLLLIFSALLNWVWDHSGEPGEDCSQWRPLSFLKDVAKLSSDSLVCSCWDLTLLDPDEGRRFFIQLPIYVVWPQQAPGWNLLMYVSLGDDHCCRGLGCRLVPLSNELVPCSEPSSDIFKSEKLNCRQMKYNSFYII